MDKNTQQIENYKKIFDKCLDENQLIKKLVLKGWFVEWLVIGIIIWQFFVIHKLHQILTFIVKYQNELSMMNGNLAFIVP